MRSQYRLSQLPRIIMLLAILGVTGVLPAAAATFEGPFVIKSVIIGGSGLHVEVSPAPTGCTADWEGTQLVVAREHVLFKELLAGFLSAQSQGKRVMVWYDPQGNGTCGFGNQKAVGTIQIKD